jgi:hypothetical protein
VQTSENARGGTSPWTVLGPVARDGRQAAWGSTRTGVVKHAFRGDRLDQLAYLELNRRAWDFDWNLMVLADGTALTTSRSENAFLIVGDRDRACMDCGIELKRRIAVPASVGQITIQFQIGFDGTLFSLLEDNRMAAIDLVSGTVRDVATIGLDADDVSFHNAFPADETGRVFLASQARMTALDWDGRRLRTAWSSAYDFRGPGCPRRATGRLREALRVMRGLPCTGTGTTPTLIGDPETGVVVLVDGHAPRNRLVAFWRDRIPADWTGIAGEDRRVAAILALPYSTPEGDGFTAENSPAAWGNAVFIAQWAGFRPACDAPRGVQRVDWMAEDRALVLRWANPEVHFNGVPTVAAGNRSVIGAGLGADCSYRYRALDIDGRFLDQGNQHAVADDGSVLYAAQEGLVRVAPPR